jgi:hypothetical protein
MKETYNVCESKGTNEELEVRVRELEVFEEFTSRALRIVRGETNDPIADACRLAETALKAARGDGLTAQVGGIGNEGLERCLKDIEKIYEGLRAEKAAAVAREAGL